MSATVAALLLAASLTWPGRHRAGPSRAVTLPAWRTPGCLRVHRRAADDAAWVAELADLTAIGLEAGLPVRDAVDAARHECAPTRHCAAWADLEGGGRGDPALALADLLAWDTGLRASERAALRDLLGGMTLSGATGAPLSVILRAQGGDLRARQAAAARARAASAGPRTTMLLLAALPWFAPLVALALGRGPFELYSNPASAVSGATGLLLAGVGLLWSRRILDRAMRPGRAGTPPGVPGGQS